MTLHPRAEPAMATGRTPGEASAAREAHHPSDRAASANHHEVLTGLRQALATPGTVGYVKRVKRERAS
jgi:hypothetical protein